MKKNPVTTIMRVLDIDKREVHVATYNFLINFHITYRDQVKNMREHLIDVCLASEEERWKTCKPGGKQTFNAIIEQEVKQLVGLCNKRNASYVRFISA